MCNQGLKQFALHNEDPLANITDETHFKVHFEFAIIMNYFTVSWEIENQFVLEMDNGWTGRTSTHPTLSVHVLLEKCSSGGGEEIKLATSVKGRVSDHW